MLLKRSAKLATLLANCLPFVAFGAGSETSAGLIVGQFRPTYATQLKGDPALPADLLIKGGHATFAKSNVIIGGRVLYGSTRANNNTSGSYYSLGTVGVVVGYGMFAKAFDLSVSSMIGVGTMHYAAANTTTPLILDASYVAAEPLMLIGFRLSQDFKVSLGGGYQLGYVHDVTQNGPSASHLEKPNEKAKIGGVGLYAQFSLVH